MDKGSQAERGDDSDKGADTEHHGNADLLAPRQLEVEDFVEREGEHPDIQCNANNGVAPGQSVDIDALPRPFLVP